MRERRNRPVPTTTILYLADRFLDGFAAVHYAASERLRSWRIERSGGYVLHLDGTCEAGSAVIFLLVESQTGLVLAAGKMATENSKDIAKLLEEVLSRFGRPLATVRDLSKNIRSAPLSRKDDEWFLNPPTHGLTTAGPQMGRLFLYTLIQWVQDYDADLEGEYFPFDLPELAFCLRCRTMLEKLEPWLKTSSLTPVQRKPLEHLRDLLLPVRESPEITATIERLQKAWNAFTELRERLRLKTEDGQPLRRDTANPKDSIEAARRVDRDLEAYRQTLKQRAADPSDPDRAEDATKIKGKLEEPWNYLLGHAVVIPAREAPILIQPTNDFVTVGCQLAATIGCGSGALSHSLNERTMASCRSRW